MIRRYVIRLERPSKYGPTYDVVHTASRGSLDAAVRHAEHLLAKHPRVITRSGGGDRRSWSCTVEDVKTGNRVYVDAPVEIVPSVGELGYW
jgi:hypothetical protein